MSNYSTHCQGSSRFCGVLLISFVFFFSSSCFYFHDLFYSDMSFILQSEVFSSPVVFIKYYVKSLSVEMREYVRKQYQQTPLSFPKTPQFWEKEMECHVLFHIHKYKICQNFCLLSTENIAGCSCSYIVSQTSFNAGMFLTCEIYRGGVLQPKYFIYLWCLGPRSPSEKGETRDAVKAAPNYQIGYTHLETEFAIAVCTDLITLFTYPGFALSLTNSSLYLVFPDCSFQCCLRRKNKQSRQAEELGEHPVHASASCCLEPALKIELPLHFCLDFSAKSLVLGYPAFHLSLLLKECLFFHGF